MDEYFRILGVSNNATLEEIKTAYKKLSKKFHPDLNPGDTYFEERFKEVQDAYDKLKSFKESSSDTNVLSDNEILQQTEETQPSKKKYIGFLVPTFIVIAIVILKPILQSSARENALQDLENTYTPSNISEPYALDENVYIADTTTIQPEITLIDSTNNNINQITLEESKSWLLSKLNKYKLDTYHYSDPKYGGSLTKSKYYDYNYNIIDHNLVVTYTFDFYEKYVDEKTLNNYYNANLSKEYALRSSNEYKVTKSHLVKETIPIKSISSISFDKHRDYNGKCNFYISTENNSVITENISTGEKNYSNFYSFEYDCSQEENLGKRLNNAIMHIKEILPTITSVSDEPF